MYVVKFSIDGLIKETTVRASDSNVAMQLITNMYGSGRIQIIDIRRI